MENEKKIFLLVCLPIYPFTTALFSFLQKHRFKVQVIINDDIGQRQQHCFPVLHGLLYYS